MKDVISVYGYKERTKNTVAKTKNTKARKLLIIILKTKKKKVKITGFV